MSPDEQVVWDALRDHRGRACAIKQAALAAACNLSVRLVQDCLKSLTENEGKAIAATCRPPYGTFVPQNDDEVSEYVGQLRARATSCFKRISALSQAAAIELHQELQQSVLPLMDSTDTRVSRICACGCGAGFVPDRPSQVYKSPLHRWEAANNRRAS